MIKNNNLILVVTKFKTMSMMLLLSCLSTSALAQDAVNHAAHSASTQAVNTAQQKSTEFTKATVRKIDLKQGKITLKHEAIQNIGMPPMTMVFKVADPALLQGIAVDDEVLFAAEKQNRQLLITALEKQQKP